MTDPVSFYYNFQYDHNSSFVRSNFPLLSMDGRSGTELHDPGGHVLRSQKAVGQKNAAFVQRSTEASGSTRELPVPNQCHESLDKTVMSGLGTTKAASNQGALSLGTGYWTHPQVGEAVTGLSPVESLALHLTDHVTEYVRGLINRATF